MFVRGRKLVLMLVRPRIIMVGGEILPLKVIVIEDQFVVIIVVIISLILIEMLKKDKIKLKEIRRIVVVVNLQSMILIHNLQECVG